MRRKGILVGVIFFVFCIVSSHPGWSEISELDRLYEEGLKAYFASSYSETLTKWEKGLELARKSDNKEAISVFLGNIGAVYSDLGQYKKALSYHEQALAIDKELGDRSGEGKALGNIGLVYWSLGQYAKALSYYEQALAIDKEIGDRSGEGAALGNIGVVYHNLGQYAKALSYYEQALAIDKEIGDRLGEGRTLGNIGVVYGVLGRYAKALTYYEQALAIHRELGDRSGEGKALGNIGLVYWNLGQYEKARQSFQESLDISLAVGAPESLWRAQRGLGAIEAKLQKQDKAILHYKQALDIIESMRGKLTEKEVKTSFMREKLFVYDELIELLQSLYKKDPGKGYDKKSLEIFERKQGRIFLEEMGKSGARNFAGIPETIIAQENNLSIQLAKFQSDLVNERSRPRKEMNTRRIRDLEKRIRTLKVEQKALEEKIRSDYPEYYAIEYPEPVTLSELQGKVLKPGEVILAYGVMEKTTCLWVIGKEENQFGFYPIDIDEKTLVQKVNYFRKGPEAVFGAIERKYPKSMIRRTARQTMPKLRESSTELYDLLIPEKARKLLNQAKTLYIVPTGPLYKLPFEALITPNENQRFLIEDHPIAYLSSASLLKTLREAAARKKEKPLYPLLAFANPAYKKTGALEKPLPGLKGMRTRAYLDIMGGGFPELPDTEDEARAIKTILQAPDQSHPLQLREAASRSRVFNLNKAEKLDDYQYVIFSCHGILPGEMDRVNQPALVLSLPDPETGKDDFLTMGDVFGLKLNADLVTLSACNTGRGKEIKGEGVRGLTRAFMYAGTPAVSVTLWSVELGSAKTISTGMYGSIKAVGGAEALRSVKRRMISGEEGELFKHPFFWAPVVIFGDGSYSVNE